MTLTADGITEPFASKRFPQLRKEFSLAGLDEKALGADDLHKASRHMGQRIDKIVRLIVLAGKHKEVMLGIPPPRCKLREPNHPHTHPTLQGPCPDVFCLARGGLDDI